MTRELLISTISILKKIISQNNNFEGLWLINYDLKSNNLKNQKVFELPNWLISLTRKENVNLVFRRILKTELDFGAGKNVDEINNLQKDNTQF
jgi:hypothetical protein